LFIAAITALFAYILNTPRPKKSLKKLSKNWKMKSIEVQPTQKVRRSLKTGTARFEIQSQQIYYCAFPLEKNRGKLKTSHLTASYKPKTQRDLI
jgi:hypothetical protein